VGTTTQPRTLKDLPPFPAAALKAMEILANEDTGVRQIADVVGMDAVFAAELLNFANSPLFGCTQRVMNLKHAMVLVGRERLRGLILTAALRGVLKGAPLDRQLFRTWWRHSLSCGLLSEGLAAACSVYCPQAYAAGLLHDMGRLGLMINVSQKDYLLFLQELLHSDEPVLALERKHFGLNHCEVAEYLEQGWQLPDDLLGMGRSHHEPGPFEKDLSGFVRESCKLASSIGFEAVPRATFLQVDGVWARLGLNPETMRQALEVRILEMERPHSKASS
jgi:HD-like signal output (HDOD) protein